MKTQNTPLRFWIYTASFFIIIYLVFNIYYEKNKSKINKHQLNYFSNELNHISQKLKNSDNNYNVIIIGSSLIGHGIPCSENIYKYSKLNITLNKLWSPGDPIKKKQLNHKTTNQLIKTKPDLVLIQTELTAIKLQYNERLVQHLFLQKITEFSSKINSMLDYFLIVPKDYTRCPKNLNVQSKTDTLSYTPKKRIIKNIDNLKNLSTIFNQLNAAGIKTVIVDIPRPISTEKEIYTASFNKELQKLLNIYKQEYEVEHWNFTGPDMYYKHFIDDGHLNENGRDIYTEWLLNKIEKEK